MTCSLRFTVQLLRRGAGQRVQERNGRRQRGGVLFFGPGPRSDRIPGGLLRTEEEEIVQVDGYGSDYIQPANESFALIKNLIFSFPRPQVH